MLNRSSVVMLVFWWPEILFVDNVVVLIGCMPFVCCLIGVHSLFCNWFIRIHPEGGHKEDFSKSVCQKNNVEVEEKNGEISEKVEMTT